MRESPDRRPTSKDVFQALRSDGAGDIEPRRSSQVTPHGGHNNAIPARPVPDNPPVHDSVISADDNAFAASSSPVLSRLGSLEESGGDFFLDQPMRSVQPDRSRFARGPASGGAFLTRPMASLPATSYASTAMHGPAEPDRLGRKVFSLQSPPPKAA